MIIAPGVGERLREERERLGLNQTAFGEAAGVSRGTQKAYELGSSSPDVRYLLAIQETGANVQYVLTGYVAIPDASSLTTAEARLLAQFQSLTEKDQGAVAHLVSALAGNAE